MTIEKFPQLSPQSAVTLDTLMCLFYEIFWTFCKFLDVSGKVPTENHADYVLYALVQELRKKYPHLKEKKDWTPKDWEEDPPID
jgi:hypothetical protein